MKPKPTTLEEFRATGLDVQDVAEATGDDTSEGPGRVYGGSCWMQPHEGQWCVTIGNDSRLLPLDEAEEMLWEWYRVEHALHPTP